MRPSLLPPLLAALAALLPALAARATPTDAIYSCVDPEGHRSYQNTNDGPHCHRLDGMLDSIPEPQSARARPIRSNLSPGLQVSPASFPRVDAGTQRVREDERRTILEQELRGEQSRLVQLRGQGGLDPLAARRVAEDIERSEGNIAALQRELGSQRF